MRAHSTRLSAAMLALLALLACGDDEPSAPESPSFAGTYVGSYVGSGGCLGEAVAGGIEFTIEQTDNVLDVTYTLTPPVDQLQIFGGSAELVAQTATSFSGEITAPPQLTGSFSGELSSEGEISGTAEGTAQVLCSGAPAVVAFEASYQGTRQ